MAKQRATGTQARSKKGLPIGRFHEKAGRVKSMIGRAWTYYYFLPIIKSMTVAVLRHQAGPSAHLKTSIPRILIGYEAQNRAYLAHLGVSHLCRTIDHHG